MSLNFQIAESVKKAIYEELNKLLNADTEKIASAEARLKQLEYTEGYGVYLAELIMNQSFDLPLRQIACIMLKRYVEKYWINVVDPEENDKKTVICAQAKRTIRNILPNGLYDPNSKIRSGVAHAISVIAAIDWPGVWTDLFDIIVKCLGGNENSIHGAMSILQEFSYDLQQIVQLGPIIIPEVFRIFESENTFSIRTRVSAIRILKPLFQSINMNVKNRAEHRRMIVSLLDTFWEKMMYYLSMDSGDKSNFLLRTEIVKLLTLLVSEMPKPVLSHIERALPIIWRLLTQIADTYVRVFVNAVEPTPFGRQEDDDDDDSNFNAMVVQIFEFIQCLSEERRLAQTIHAVLADLIYIVIVYVQLTEEQLELWADDAELFVEQENEAGSDLTVRLAGQDVLNGLMEDEFEPLPPLHEALRRHMNVAEAEKAAGNPHWWKILEACMLAVHTFREHIIENRTSFDLANYLTFVRTLLGYTDCPLLVGRALWTLSSYAETKLITPPVLEEILHVTVQSLEHDQPQLLKLSAMRSVFGFVHGHKGSNDECHALVSSKLTCFFEGALSLIPSSKVTVMTQLVEVITALARFDGEFTASVQDRIITICISVYVRFPEDPLIQLNTNSLLRILVQNPMCVANVQKRLVPTLMSILNNPKSDMIRQELALDILAIVVKFAKAPLSDDLMETAFPVMLDCALRSEDYSVMVSGGECLRAYIHVAADQVGAFQNGQGLNYVMQLTTALLNPMTSEMTAVQAGRLVITIILKMGPMLGENVDLLLKAVISKMQLVDSLAVTMSLVTVFAHLFLTQMEAVMNFLSTVPGPTGEPAMMFVFQKWLARPESFYGVYERKVNTLSLCKIFEYGITSQDSRLTTITITEPAPTSQAGGRMQTRSQSHPQVPRPEVTTPALVKIFKILVNELKHLSELALADQDTNSGDEEDDDDDVAAPQVGNGAEVVGAYDHISDLIFDDDEEEDSDDEDQLTQELMKEPIFQVNMLDNLTKFFREFTKNEHYPVFSAQLTDVEKQFVRPLE